MVTWLTENHLPVHRPSQNTAFAFCSWLHLVEGGEHLSAPPKSDFNSQAGFSDITAGRTILIQSVAYTNMMCRPAEFTKTPKEQMSYMKWEIQYRMQQENFWKWKTFTWSVHLTFWEDFKMNMLIFFPNQTSYFHHLRKLEWFMQVHSIFAVLRNISMLTSKNNNRWLCILRGDCGTSLTWTALILLGHIFK